MPDEGRVSSREAALAERHDLVNRARDAIDHPDLPLTVGDVLRDLLAEVRDAPVRWSGA